MYPFRDYYVQFGIVLKDTPYDTFIPLHYDVYEQAICLILFLLLLSVEIFVSIIRVLTDFINLKEKLNHYDYMQGLYDQSIDNLSITAKIH